MIAVPLAPSAKNFTRTSPLCVRASRGSMRPIVVVNDTSVPLCTGVPAAGVLVAPVPVPVDAVPRSMTVATISTSPLAGTVSEAGRMVMTVPVGASKGILSHAETNGSAKTAVRSASVIARRRPPPRGVCGSIRDDKDNTLMYLGGQANQRGYAMAALLVAIALMAVVMTALLPAWRQQVQREKEAELAFRGEQYARAIALFRQKNGNMNPPSIDVLVQGRYIRKKFKDPFTEDGEFQTLTAGQQQSQPGPPGPPGRGGRGSTPPGVGGGVPQSAMSGGGILTVRSKSKQASIRIYNGGAHYNEWNFV